MLPNEKIHVFVQFRNGRTICICMRKRKCKYGKECLKDVVERDRYNGWEESLMQDKYGHATELSK